MYVAYFCETFGERPIHRSQNSADEGVTPETFRKARQHLSTFKEKKFFLVFEYGVQLSTFLLFRIGRLPIIWMKAPLAELVYKQLKERITNGELDLAAILGAEIQ